VAAVLTEPALTNCGLVPPRPGFLKGLQQACRDAGTALMLDETHTVSAGWGGMARAEGLSPDFLVVGKAVAGGVPCAAYGFTEAMAQRMQAAKEAAPEGHSGIGTTLAGSLLSLAALRATLAELMTPAVYAGMQSVADHLELRLRGLIAQRGLPWSVARLGARMELQFRAQPPATAAEARAAMQPTLESALHLFLLNRGLLLTPFHTMVLVCPDTSIADVDRLADTIAAFVDEGAPTAARGAP
jgi:glutamate-1-semialdehyde 2,1-aminomutase